MSRGSRVGIMGGTFDPIHNGHLILAERAYEQFDLDYVLFMPAGNPPHKRNRRGRATDDERLEMTRLAIAGNSHFRLSDREMRESGYTYSYETLENMRKEDPLRELYFIIGEDSLFDFETWKEPERICRACTLLVAPRSSSPEALDEMLDALRERHPGARAYRISHELLDISSTGLRELASAGRSIRYYTPDPVAELVKKHEIYMHWE